MIALSKQHTDLLNLKDKTIPLFNHQEAQTGSIAFTNTGKTTITGEGAINTKALQAYQEVFVTENILDLIQLIKQDQLNVIYAHDGLLDQAYYKAPKKALELIFLFDPLNLEELKEFNLTISKIDKPDLTNLEDAILTREVLHQPKLTGVQINQDDDDEITFTFSNVRYQLIGINRIRKMRINVILTVFCNGNSFTDSVSLYSFKSRRSVSRHIADELNLQVKRVEKHLITILNHLQELVKERLKSSEPEPVVLTKEEHDQAVKFLSQKNLLGNITDKIQEISSLAGEELNIKLSYLIAISRLTNTNLAGMVRSSSGSGKSFLLNSIANVTPPEDILFLSRLSKNALFYHDNLDKKLIIVDEAEGSNDAIHALRTLISSKKLSVSFVDRDPFTGKQKTVTNEIHANVSYLDSSTGNTEPEFESRAFILKVAETPRQTEAIFQAQRDKKKGLNSTVNTDIKLLQNIQRVLRPLPVIIDYADKITFFNKHLKARRWFAKFLDLISVSAFLNQYRRKIKQGEGGEYIIANKEDYSTAYQMIKFTMADSFSELDSVVLEVWQAIYSNIEQLSFENKLDITCIEFTRSDISKFCNKPLYILKRLVPVLISAGYLDKVSASGQGGKHKYVISEKYEAIDPFKAMKTPLELFGSTKQL